MRATDPCASLLTGVDLATLGLDPGTARQRVYAQAVNCDWNADAEKSSPSLSIATTPYRNKFVDAYRTRVLPIFISTTVAGYPAVLQTSEPGDFMCQATVAVNDDEGVTATWFAKIPINPPTEACDNATKALAAVVAHLPPR